MTLVTEEWLGRWHTLGMETVLTMLVREEQDADFELISSIKSRAQHEGWRTILLETLEVLSDRDQTDHWRSAICIIYWASSPDLETPIAKMEIVARLFWCLRQLPDTDGNDLNDLGNLVWSAAIGLKGVPYLSEWVPEEDPEVRKFLDEME